jgi:hypothetical protein
MGIGKQHTLGGQSVKIGGFGVGMAIHASEPVIQIIHCDKKYIGIVLVGIG